MYVPTSPLIVTFSPEGIVRPDKKADGPPSSNSEGQGDDEYSHVMSGQGYDIESNKKNDIL